IRTPEERDVQIKETQNKNVKYESSDENGEITEKSETPRTSDKVGRNDLCPCGSGKKYKKCCGRV
ncbi:MAG: hypothetical protein DSY38_04320, partial [Fusobacteria bacterium]